MLSEAVSFMRTILIAAILLPISLFGHDMWIEPTAAAPQPGQIVGLKLRVGQGLLGDPLPRQAALVKQFVVDDAEGRREAIGREGADPAGLILMRKGLAVAGYESNASHVEMDAAKFEAYLKEEGLEAVAKERARLGQTGSGVREAFFRCAKLLLAAGSHAGVDRRLGFALELVAEKNPFGLAAGQTLPLRLTYQDKPLAGALVVAINRRDAKARVSARTDRQGRVRLAVPGGGLWMIKAVHMVRATAEQKADWASFWASLTFARSDPPKADAAQSGGH